MCQQNAVVYRSERWGLLGNMTPNAQNFAGQALILTAKSCELPALLPVRLWPRACSVFYDDVENDIHNGEQNRLNRGTGK